MSFRVVYIESESRISAKLNNLIVDKGDGEIWIPFDDISMIVIDNLRISLTARMFSILAENNIGIIITDQAHTPIGFYSSYDNHSRMSKTIGYQIDKTKEYYNILWKQIVIAKIENQAKCINKIYNDSQIIQKLRDLSLEVNPGDTTNREAHAAKIYFNCLMQSTYSRGNEDILLNSGLDYGYSIIRSFIARVCVGYGLNTQLGIHHCNEYNRFNLVDDLIEPFRPIVDYYAYGLLNDEEYFKPEHRHALVNLLNHRFVYNSKKMYLCNAIEEYVEGYASYLAGNREQFVLPDLDNYLGEEDEI